MSLVCARCHKSVGLMGRLSFDSKYQRCGDCQKVIRANLDKYRKDFLEACRDGLLTESEWSTLEAKRQMWEIQPEEGSATIRRDAMNFLERTFAFAKADGHLEEQEEYTIRWLAKLFDLQSSMPHIANELAYLVRLREIRNGNIDAIKTSAVLPIDEIAYLETPVALEKAKRSTTELIPGKLLVTNKRIIFTAHTGGGEVKLNRVTNVYSHRNGIFLELSQGKLNGYYQVNDPQIIAETILSVVKMAARQLIGKGDKDTRRISQEVKMAVWQRDQGKCVQCGATEYLEFDHVIPFSKGGATSVNNLQLLCRKCNLAKGGKL